MPKTTREWAIRKLSQAEGNLDWSQKHLVEIAETYVEHHPEISKMLLDITNLQELTQQAIKTLRENI